MKVKKGSSEKSSEKPKNTLKNNKSLNCRIENSKVLRLIDHDYESASL